MAVWESWLQENPVPVESIYYWMYDAGLRGFPESQLEQTLISSGKQIRQKDWDNYRRGYARSYFTGESVDRHLTQLSIRPKNIDFTATHLHQFGRSNKLINYDKRWVPCSKNNKPLIQWSRTLTTYEEAIVFPDSIYLAECMYSTPYIVFDIDGDHNDVLHLDLIEHFAPLINITHALVKQRTVSEYTQGLPKHILSLPTSFHLTFRTDRLIPTKHFPNACIDLLGNKAPQLRYRKTKQWNHVFPALLTEKIWRYFMDFIAMKEKAV